MRVDGASRSAEFTENDDERFVEKRLRCIFSRHRGEIREQRAEGRIEDLHLREETVAGLCVDVRVMIPSAHRHLHEARAAMGGDEIARHDERLADVAAAVLRVVIEREAEDLVRVRRVDEAFRLVVETSHVGGELSELAGGAIGIDRSKKIPAIRESRGAVGMRERSEPVLRRRHAEWRVHRRQISAARHHLTDGDEAGKDVGVAARLLRFERHDGADVRRDAARCAAGIARDLHPSLRERMHGRPRKAGANDGQPIELLRGLRHQPLRETHRAVRRRIEIGQRRPRPFLQVPRIDVTRPTVHEQEDAVFGGARKVRRPAGAFGSAIAIAGQEVQERQRRKTGSDLMKKTPPVQ